MKHDESVRRVVQCDILYAAALRACGAFASDSPKQDVETPNNGFRRTSADILPTLAGPEAGWLRQETWCHSSKQVHRTATHPSQLPQCLLQVRLMPTVKVIKPNYLLQTRPGSETTVNRALQSCSGTTAATSFHFCSIGLTHHGGDKR